MKSRKVWLEFARGGWLYRHIQTLSCQIQDADALKRVVKVWGEMDKDNF